MCLYTHCKHLRLLLYIHPLNNLHIERPEIFCKKSVNHCNLSFFWQIFEKCFGKTLSTQEGNNIKLSMSIIFKLEDQVLILLKFHEKDNPMMEKTNIEAKTNAL